MKEIPPPDCEAIYNHIYKRNALHDLDIVFHVPSLSHHVMAPFIELGERYNVTFVTTNIGFRNLGAVDTKGFKVIKVQSTEDVDKVIEKFPNSYHFVWGGLKQWESAHFTYYATKKLCQQRYKVVAIFQEQYPWNSGIKGFARRMMWFWKLRVSVFRHLTGIGCTGASGVIAYRKACIPKAKLFDFCYLPEEIECDDLVISEDCHRFLFVGRLDERKSIRELCNVFSRIAPSVACSLTIAGAGVYMPEVEEWCRKDSRISYVGSVSREEAAKLFCSHDTLILPSKFDGWGVVVNEALAKGMRCIVSDVCGAHSLLVKRPKLGYIFPTQNWDALYKVMIEDLSRGPQTMVEKEEIRQWAQCISPKTGADYLIKILQYLMRIRDNKPIAPWSVVD